MGAPASCMLNHLWVHTCVRMHVCARVRACVCVCVCVCVRVCVWMYNTHKNTHTYEHRFTQGNRPGYARLSVRWGRHPWKHALEVDNNINLYYVWHTWSIWLVLSCLIHVIDFISFIMPDLHVQFERFAMPHLRVWFECFDIPDMCFDSNGLCEVTFLYMYTCDIDERNTYTYAYV